METQKITTNQKTLIILVAFIVIVSATLLYFKPFETGFCFTFTYDTQFGDKKDFKNASNTGVTGPGGVEYYPIEVKALQTALKNEGLYIDPSEETGGGVYLAAYFGPSTQTAVRNFQEKSDIAITGEVNNNTIDALNKIYACKTPKTTLSTSPATTTVESVQ